MIIEGMKLDLTWDERKTLFHAVIGREHNIKDLLKDDIGLPADFVKWAHGELKTLARIRDKIGGTAS